jgi:hypothetical protein
MAWSGMIANRLEQRGEGFVYQAKNLTLSVVELHSVPITETSVEVALIDLAILRNPVQFTIER